MGNSIFKKILERKIEIFISTFGSDAESLFINYSNKLIHPLEYGMYRESVFKELINIITPNNINVADGFIITSQGRYSTQCDVLLYDGNINSIVDNGIAKFFPVECLCAIGEIKSSIQLKGFKDALVKLAKNKKLMDEKKGNCTKKFEKFKEYDSMVSFLVCKKFDFSFDNLDFKDIYGDIEQKYWHNAILSIEDGCFLYEIDFSELPEKQRVDFLSRNGNITKKSFWNFPIHASLGETYLCNPCVLSINNKEQYAHIIHFLTTIVTPLKDLWKYDFDFVEYLGWGGSIFDKPEG